MVGWAPLCACPRPGGWPRRQPEADGGAAGHGRGKATYFMIDTVVAMEVRGCAQR